jgi:hypothetical protein
MSINGEGLHEVVWLVVLIDLAAQAGARSGASVARTAFTHTDPAVWQLCVDHDVADPEWSSRFGLRTSPAQDEDMVARLFGSLGMTDMQLGSLRRRGEIDGGDEFVDEFRAALVTVWECEFIVAHETTTKQLAAERLAQQEGRHEQ